MSSNLISNSSPVIGSVSRCQSGSVMQLTQEQKKEKIRQLKEEIRQNKRKATDARSDIVRKNCFTRAFFAEYCVARLESELRQEAIKVGAV